MRSYEYIQRKSKGALDKGFNICWRIKEDEGKTCANMDKNHEKGNAQTWNDIRGSSEKECWVNEDSWKS